MKKLFLFLIWIILIVSFSGCGSEEKVNDEQISWDSFVGENKGKTDIIKPAPEVDENGDYIQSDTTARKPGTNIVSEVILTQSPVSENASSKECLEKWLESFKKSDWSQVKYLSNGFDSFKSSSDENVITDYIFKKIKYSIGSSSEENGTAEFDVEIEVPDIKESLKTYIQNEQIDPNSTDIKSEIDKAIKSLVEKAKTKKENTKITLTKDDSAWKVNITDDVLSTVSCGLSDLYRELLQEYFEEVKAQ